MSLDKRWFEFEPESEIWKRKRLIYLLNVKINVKYSSTQKWPFFSRKIKKVEMSVTLGVLYT